MPTDPVVEQYHQARCPAGFDKKIDLDNGNVICEDAQFNVIPPTYPTKTSSLGVVGWGAIISATLAGAALLIHTIKRRR